MKKIRATFSFALTMFVAGLALLIFNMQARADSLSVTRGTLSNGLQVVVVHNPLAPVAFAELNYKAGANEQDFAGQAHALEHMMFRGSKTISQSQLADVAELLGGLWDADTQSEVTQYFFLVPSQYLDVAVRLEASRARNLTLNQNDWNIERGAIKNEVTQDYSDPLTGLELKMDLDMFAGTPYGNDGLGTLQSFDKQINTPQLRQLYNAWYHPNNAVYVIVGDVDGPATLKIVQQYFGSVPSAKLPPRKPVHLPPLAPRTIRVESDKPYNVVALAYRFPGYHSKDYAAGQVLEAVLSSQRADLFGLVASGKALQATFSDFDTHPLAGSAAAIVAVPVSTKPDDALAMLRDILNNYRRGGVPADLVDAEKRRAIAQYKFQANSVFGLGFQWSQAIAVQGLSSPGDMLSATQAVTVDDVNRVLRTYVNPAHEIVGIAAPKNLAATAGAAGGAPVGNENKPTLIHHDPLPAWVISEFQHVTVPESTLNPVDTTLSNGLRLIVVPEHVSQTVVVRGSIASSEAMQAPPGKDGVDDVTAGVLPFGTITYDRLGLRVELDKITADVTAGTSFSLSVLSQDFDRGVQLLADEELHPSFPTAGFDAVKGQRLGVVQADVRSPDHVAQVALNKALYPTNDPAQRFSTPETVSSLTLDDAKAYYNSVYRPDMTTIVAVGDVDPAQAKAVFEKYFGAWKASGPKPKVDPPAVPANATADTVVPDPQRSQSQVQMAQVLSLTRTDPDYAALSVANQAFGGGGTSILFHDVRDIHGLVYSVGSEFGFEKNRSTFEIDYSCDPSKINAARSLINADLKNLATNGLDAGALARGKASYVALLPARVSSFNGIGRQLASEAQLGLSLDQATIDARNAIATTNDQIKAAVAKWIRTDGFVRIILGPGP